METIQEKRTPKSPKKQNMNLPHADNYLHKIYIVLGIIHNLMSKSLWEDVHEL